MTFSNKLLTSCLGHSFDRLRKSDKRENPRSRLNDLIKDDLAHAPVKLYGSLPAEGAAELVHGSALESVQ